MDSAAGHLTHAPTRRDSAVAAGVLAPEFTATDHLGRQHDLRQYFGGRTWLAFFRHAACPMCLLRVHEMMRRFPRWAAPDFQVLGVFHSTPERIAGNVGRMEPPFPLLSDPDGKLYRRYGLSIGSPLGLAHPGALATIARAACKGFHLSPPRQGEPWGITPGDFLIDEGGAVRTVYHGRHMGDHIPFDSVERWLGFKLDEG